MRYHNKSKSQPHFADRSVAQVFDDKAKSDPQSIFVKVPVSTKTYADGFCTVNYRRIVDAANHIAHTIERRWGKSSDFECLGYIGPSDVSYVAVWLACIKTGYKVSV